jgi:hypothetical protein
MSKPLAILSLLLVVGAALPSIAEEGSPVRLNRVQSVINAFEVMCAIEMPVFEYLDTKAAAMRMTPLANSSRPSANNTTYREKAWAGQLTSGPFLLLIDEMSGAKGKLTSCAIVADVPDADAFRLEAIKAMKLSNDPPPELRDDGSRSYIWHGAFGSGTTVIDRDFAPRGKPGVMLKLSIMRGPAQ